MVAGDNRTELDLLRDIARWTRELALPQVKERVERLLDSDAKRRVYAALEAGDVSLQAIEKATGANRTRDISPWIKLWTAEGIVDEGSTPPKATFTLAELGIEPAPPKSTRAPSGDAR